MKIIFLLLFPALSFCQTRTLKMHSNHGDTIWIEPLYEDTVWTKKDKLAIYRKETHWGNQFDIAAKAFDKYRSIRNLEEMARCQDSFIYYKNLLKQLK